MDIDIVRNDNPIANDDLRRRPYLRAAANIDPFANAYGSAMAESQ